VDREHALFRLFGKFCTEGTILFTEGSAGQEAFVIQSGVVRLGAARPEGGRAGLLGPGDLLGEGALASSPKRSSRAEVVQDARLLQISVSTLDAVVRHGPQTARLIFDQLLERTQVARVDLHAWIADRLLQRTAPFLLASAEAGTAAAALAEQSGLSEADALLVLEELGRRGSLRREGERFRAPDVARLRLEIDGIAAAGRR